jgi:hypothetical protein
MEGSSSVGSDSDRVPDHAAMPKDGLQPQLSDEARRQQDHIDKLVTAYRLEKGELVNSMEEMTRSMRSPFQRGEKGPPCQDAREDVVKCYRDERSKIVGENDPLPKSPESLVGYVSCGEKLQSFLRCMQETQRAYYGKLQVAKKVAAAAHERDRNGEQPQGH